MPCRSRSTAAVTSRRRRSQKYKDKDRYHCPYPGCGRSCAELWRLKVHYRAPSNIRGSGVERGHGTELEFCPKCKEKLEVGKNHGHCRPLPALPHQLPLTTQPRDQVAVSGSADDTVIRTSPSVGHIDSDGRDNFLTSDELSSFVSHSSLDSGQLLSTPDDTDLSVLSSPTYLMDAAVLKRPESLMSSEPRETEVKVESQTESLLECDMDDEVVLPHAFAPALERGGRGAFHLPSSHTDLISTSPQSRLWPVAELLDLASYEANLLKMLALRTGPPRSYAPAP